MLSMETMGYYSDEPKSQKYPPVMGLIYPDVGDFIGFVGNMGSRKLVRQTEYITGAVWRCIRTGTGSTPASQAW